VLPSAVRAAAWTPEKEGPWFEELSVVDAVVHLAGEPVIRRWTEEAKRAIDQSRAGSTRLLVEAIGRAKPKPSVLVCGSAIGYYGSRGADDRLDEDAPAGKDFLAEVARRWEEAASAAEQHGVRVVELRIGVVLGEHGGALERMVRPFKMYLGGPIGQGSQIVSWVHRDDVVGMILFSVDDERVRGPMNAVSPYPVSSEQLAQALGIVLNRPSWFRAPGGVLKMAFGEGAEVLLKGQRAYPKKAVELGYEFRHARLLPALESILAA
jgi:uncharacterized protein (TIGR01777 family)